LSLSPSVPFNRLKGTLGDKLNALFSAAAMNFRKLLGFFLAFLFRLLSALLPARPTVGFAVAA
jgi:IS5 family transposase